MPRILVTAERDDGQETAVLLHERVRAEEVDSAHFSARLLERLCWALRDAEVIECVPAPER